MILIFSIVGDVSTDNVTSWLDFYNKEYIRLNYDSDEFVFEEISADKISINMKGVSINLLECESVWYRKNGLSMTSFSNGKDLQSIKQLLKANFKEDYIDEFITTIQNEYKTVQQNIYYTLKKRAPSYLGPHENTVPNKLTVLNIAEEEGLKTPKTYMLKNKDILSNILDHESLITKAFSDGIYHISNKSFISYTEKIEKKDLGKIPDSFFMSFFQEQIVKEYELRVFYIRGKFYSTAIFSQKNKSTIVDSRRSSGLGVRHLPYNLPKEIEQKLDAFMKRLAFETGSIDMIVDDQGDYIFLEINPTGQISGYATYCNYHIEKEIAEML